MWHGSVRAKWFRSRVTFERKRPLTKSQPRQSWKRLSEIVRLLTKRRKTQLTICGARSPQCVNRLFRIVTRFEIGSCTVAAYRGPAALTTIRSRSMRLDWNATILASCETGETVRLLTETRRGAPSGSCSAGGARLAAE